MRNTLSRAARQKKEVLDLECEDQSNTYANASESQNQPDSKP